MFCRRAKTVSKKVAGGETQIAKDALLNNNRRGALFALKKKKCQEQLLRKSDAQLLNLEKLLCVLLRSRRHN
ncbi:unnamed protein product [Rhizophagus irregularis]|nr:unnamed protein product [Rhizophagus irregularis]